MKTCEKIAHDASDSIAKLNTNLVVSLLNDIDVKIESKLAQKQDS